MFPAKCEMPDLSGLVILTGGLFIVHVLTGDQGLNRQEGFYRRNFIRLTDQGVLEYQDARSALITMIEEGSAEVIPTGAATFFQFVRHLENCINAISRLLKIADRIKSNEGLLKVPREIRRFIEPNSENILNIRNTIEHMDEKIQKGEIGDGEPVMFGFGIKGNSVIIAGYEVQFFAIATILRRLHEVAPHLLETKV